MPLVARADLTTGCAACASYVTRSKQLVFAFTAPLTPNASSPPASACPYPGYDRADALAFIAAHGTAVRAVGVAVEDAAAAYEAAVASGGIAARPPHTALDADGAPQTTAEIMLYGDVRLRFVSGRSEAPFFAGYAADPAGAAAADGPGTLGLDRLDHAVGNVPALLPAANYVMAATGFHEFAEFTAEDVGTVDSGLNSVVLANNDENVLLPINEPVHGTRRQSQIQTFLDHHGGAGVQHLALKTEDAFATLRGLRARAAAGGGVELHPPASPEYYAKLRAKVGDVLSEAQLKECEELGLLVDRDDQGVLLQIFTRPLSDRPTLFLEIIQRVGCVRPVPAGEAAVRRESAATTAAALAAAGKEDGGDATVPEQAGGCGGFGKGNFSELFKSIEDYEKSILGE
jgi:4-hydroxyphenylpyruvate dioxygenase